MSDSEIQFEERPCVRNARLSGNRLCALLPTTSIEDGLVVNVDGSYGIGWRCSFPYLRTLSPGRCASIFDTMKRMIGVLSADFDVQIMFDQSHRVEEFSARLSDIRTDNTILTDLAAEQRDYLLHQFKHGNLRWIDGYVFLVRKNPFPRSHFTRTKGGTFGRLRALFSSANNEIAYTEQEWERLKPEFFEFADSVHQELEQAGFAPEVLNADAALTVLYRYYNPADYDAGFRPRRYDPTENIALTNLYAPGELDADRETGRIQVQSRQLKVCVVRTPPEQVCFGQFANLLIHEGLNKTKCIITLRQADLEKRKKLVKERLPELQAAAKKDKEFVFAAAEADRELTELGRGNEKAWLLQQVFVVGGDDTQELERNVLLLRKAAEQSSGMRVDVEKHACLDYLIAAQPFWTRDKDVDRLLPFNTSQAVTQMPVYGQVGHFTILDGKDAGRDARMGMVCETVAQTLFNFLPHEDRRFSNANMMVLGAAGKGKGMFINGLVAEMRMRHPSRFVIIDIGGSYRKTSEALCPGGYFEMSLKQTGRVINPFYTANNAYPDQDEIDGMVRFVEKLVVGQDEKRIEPEYLAIIEQAITQLFRGAEGKREVTLGELRHLLQNDSRAEKIAQRLGRWTGNGSFANLFDGKNQLDVSNWLTVFDLTAIKDNKQVCPVMFGVIFSVVAQLAARYPKDFKFAVFDECADFLRDPLVASYIETCYRQMRKYGVSVVGISQTLEEWLSTSSRNGFVSNTTHLVIFGQDSQDAAVLLRNTFALSEQEFGIVTHLQSIPGEFSQALLWQKTGEGRSESTVIIKRPTPLGYALGTTNPRDKAYFQELRDSGLSYVDAVRRFSREYPQGVARGRAA